jgi:hypothetical protein
LWSCYKQLHNIDSEPVFVLPVGSTVSLAEDSTDGTSVYAFSVTDDDGDTGPTFSIASQSVANTFETNPANTEVVVASGVSFDFEGTTKEYTVTVQ